MQSGLPSRASLHECGLNLGKGSDSVSTVSVLESLFDLRPLQIDIRMDRVSSGHMVESTWSILRVYRRVWGRRLGAFY